MMLTTLLSFCAGSIAGLGAWWFSLDRRRGKEMRKLAHAHRLYVDAVHDASVRALQYGFAEDFVFLVHKAHPQAEGKNVAVLRPAWSIDLGADTPFVEEDQKVP